MANPSISVPDELLNEFDDTIWRLKQEGELGRKTSRSEVIQMLMTEWVEEHGGNPDSGNPIEAALVAN